MKFAKELDSDLVPEWRAKYLDYKTGKKKLKAITRALRNAERTPQFGGRTDPGSSTFRYAPKSTFVNTPNSLNDGQKVDTGAFPTSALTRRNGAGGDGEHEREAQGTSAAASGALPIPTSRRAGEHMPLQGAGADGQQKGQYGSIIASPPTTPSWNRQGAPSLKLPGPAIAIQDKGSPELTTSLKPQRTLSSQSAYQIGPPNHSSGSPLAQRKRTMFTSDRVSTAPGSGDISAIMPRYKRTFTFTSARSGASSDIALNAYHEVDNCQAEFFTFLDKEREKIEEFYKQKEDEATERLKVLREQLHIMRDKRVEELLDITAARTKHSHQDIGINNDALSRHAIQQNGDETKSLLKKTLHFDPLHVRNNRAKTAEAMKKLGTPSGPQAQDAMQDYVRRKKPHEVPYKAAKQKLKIALAEYYRGLELLKAYALLNRTAFRKITKKYDKTVNARPSGRYMNEKVNNAYFVKSTVLESYIQAVEDLYARYFERGNHKIAVGKLRAKGAHAGDYTGSVFRNGLLLGIGAVFAIQALVYAAELLENPNSVLVVQTQYLLQLYGGYAMMLLLTLLFCLDCRVWQRAKVNYAFIFEFDTRHNLDWRQLAEIPCFLGFFLGLIMWLNFSRFGGEDLYIYWPVILIAVAVVVIFVPLPILYHRSRFWFIRSNWRLSVAGLYPVEFRDFFLGDMYCSQTYALGNIELFFCLYAHFWSSPTQCNSSNSRLLGFFSTLPGIWRFLQCLRRYWDTKNIFPHLVNGGKYMCTILYYMSLSLYRINKTSELRALFIFFATINAVYCSVWDIVMDWSLGDPYAKHRFLRKTLAFKYAWWYYLAMFIDPIIRFNWIFYAIYGHETQHSSIVSFFVAFSEVMRRGMWTLFRVENEHCTNVGRFRASRDVPLPYDMSLASEDSKTSKSSSEHSGRPSAATDEEAQAAEIEAASGGIEPAAGLSSSTDVQGQLAGARQRIKTMAAESPIVRAFSRVGTLLHAAHAQDFERRRRPELGHEVEHGIDEDDDDEEDDDASTDREIGEVGAAIEERRRMDRESAAGATKRTNDPEDMDDADRLLRDRAKTNDAREE